MVTFSLLSFIGFRKIMNKNQIEKTHNCRNHRASWSLKEIRYVEKHYGKKKTQDIANKLGRTAAAIRLQAKKSGCKQFRQLPWTEEEKQLISISYLRGDGINVLRKHLPHRSKRAIFAMAESMGLLSQRRWRQWEIDILKRDYGTEGTSVKKQLNGRTQDGIRQKARSLGLVYSGDLSIKNYCAKK